MHLWHTRLPSDTTFSPPEQHKHKKVVIKRLQATQKHSPRVTITRLGDLPQLFTTTYRNSLERLTITR